MAEAKKEVKAEVKSVGDYQVLLKNKVTGQSRMLTVRNSQGVNKYEIFMKAKRIDIDKSGNASKGDKIWEVLKYGKKAEELIKA
jgi:hypothetical protein